MDERELLDIPQEEFEFAKDKDFGHDQKFDTKPISYLKDALIRFSKNKGSVVAGIILLIFVAFALLFPLVVSNNTKNVRDSYYAKKTARLTWAYNIGIDGGKTIQNNENIVMKFYSVGVGAEYKYDENTHQETHASFAQGEESYYQPVIKLYGEDTSRVGSSILYKAKIDEYLGVGFIYRELSKQQYNDLVKFEKSVPYKILYPMIDTNSEYCYDTEDANFWYMASKDNRSKGAPLTKDGKVQSLRNNNIQYNDIYLRDSNGLPLFYTRIGGGDQDTASFKVRVLYYNYYRYLYGEEPNYLFGTDSQGYDFAYRLATGMRLSFGLAIFVSVINFIIGALYGAIEGYYGGVTDLVMERITDILVDVPFIVVATLFQLHFSAKVGGFVSLLFAFVLTGWIGTASRVRSQFYRFKNQEYVLAARTLGARDRRIMWKHIFPNSLGTIITSSVLVIPSVIFSESMLSYLGIVSLGSSSSTSLGTLLSEASKLWTQFPHLMIFPAVIISLLMICFNLFGNGLRDAFNPTLRGADQ